MSSSRRTCCNNNNRVGGIIPFLNLIIAAACFFTHFDAGRSSLHDVSGGPGDSFIIQHMKKMRMTRHFDWASLLLQRETLDSPQNTGPYVGSPFTLPPYTSLPPVSIPDNSPPYCLYPPNTPQPPSTTVPFPPIGGEFPSPPPPISSLPPLFPIPSPPPGPPVEGGAPAPPVEGGSLAPPVYVLGPPVEGGAPAPPVEGGSPAPFVYVPGPPSGPTLSPPYSYTPSPPAGYVPSPTGFVPSPPTVFLPPIVYPRHATPPPPRLTPTTNLWCVAKPAVPDPILEEAMNYACGSGAECESIQPSGPCFSPNTYLAHASYAFNSYWQRTKVAGGTCSFGGTAMLVTVDPSYDGCHFLFS